MNKRHLSIISALAMVLNLGEILLVQAQMRGSGQRTPPTPPHRTSIRLALLPSVPIAGQPSTVTEQGNAQNAPLALSENLLYLPLVTNPQGGEYTISSDQLPRHVRRAYDNLSAREYQNLQELAQSDLGISRNVNGVLMFSGKGGRPVRTTRPIFHGMREDQILLFKIGALTPGMFPQTVRRAFGGDLSLMEEVLLAGKRFCRNLLASFQRPNERMQLRPRSP